MEISLYNNASMPNVVYKQKTLLRTLNGTLKEDVNREHVVVTVPYADDYASINYAYIPNFKRFYFVSVENLKGVRLRLTMDSDGLSSFWNNFKYSQCIAKRSSSNYNPDIKDDLLAFKPQPIYIRRKTSNKFTPSSSGYCYVLTLGGKY